MSDEDLDIDEVLVLEEVSVELALAVWEPTGDAGIDAALDELTRLEDLPPGSAWRCTKACTANCINASPI